MLAAFTELGRTLVKELFWCVYVCGGLVIGSLLCV